MSKIADAIFQGKSVKSFSFQVYYLGTAFKVLGAVYVITKRKIDTAGRGNHTFIYIGHTGDLSERFDDARKATCLAPTLASSAESQARTRLSLTAESRQVIRTPPLFHPLTKILIFRAASSDYHSQFARREYQTYPHWWDDGRLARAVCRAEGKTYGVQTHKPR